MSRIVTIPTILTIIIPMIPLAIPTMVGDDEVKPFSRQKISPVKNANLSNQFFHF